jgi:uncharacterized protein (TIGR02246 family)
MTNGMSKEKEAIQRTLSNFEEAWNNHDVKAFSLVFAHDADFTNVFGQTSQGRSAIEQFHAPMFSTMFKDSRLALAESNIRFIKPDVAAVDVMWEMTGATDPSGDPWPERKGLINLIMTNENEDWIILVMHNMDLPETLLK